ncbi:MAG: hypothetical protein RIQ62_325 [Bacteroidota bacterium]|jgi:hypothetical protein
MYIYNVSIKILPEIESEWLQWMREEHMDDVLATGMFDQYSLFRMVDPVDEDGLTFVAQYQTDSRERYEQYIKNNAPALREKGYARFGDRFIAFRTIMEKC